MKILAWESVTVNDHYGWKEAGVGVYMKLQNAARARCSPDRGECNGPDLAGRRFVTNVPQSERDQYKLFNWYAGGD